MGTRRMGTRRMGTRRMGTRRMGSPPFYPLGPPPTKKSPLKGKKFWRKFSPLKGRLEEIFFPINHRFCDLKWKSMDFL